MKILPRKEYNFYISFLKSGVWISRGRAGFAFFNHLIGLDVSDWAYIDWHDDAGKQTEIDPDKVKVRFLEVEIELPLIFLWWCTWWGKEGLRRKLGEFSILTKQGGRRLFSWNPGGICSCTCDSNGGLLGFIWDKLTQITGFGNEK